MTTSFVATNTLAMYNFVSKSSTARPDSLAGGSRWFKVRGHFRREDAMKTVQTTRSSAQTNTADTPGRGRIAGATY